MALSSINNDKTLSKVSTQLAIWSILNIGNSPDSDYQSLASQIITLFGNDSPISDSIWLAESPANNDPGGSGGLSQDYLVSVPDASIMFLLGPALLGLGLLGRRKSKK